MENDRDFREMLAELLMHEGYHSVMAGSGREALDRLAYVTPDLIVTDLVMPTMNGAEMLRALHADARTRDIPTVVLTSLEPAVADAMLGDRRAETVVVAKPIRIPPFLNLIERCLGGGYAGVLAEHQAERS